MGFGFARVRIKGIRISEGLLYYVMKRLKIIQAHILKSCYLYGYDISSVDLGTEL